MPINGALVKTNIANNQKLTTTRERQYWMTRTNAKGQFQIDGLPAGNGNRNHARMSVYPRGYGEYELTQYRSADGSFPYTDTAPSSLHPGNYNRLALADPQSGESRVKVDLPIGKASPIPVVILNPDGKPATAELEIYGGNERWG